MSEGNIQAVKNTEELRSLQYLEALRIHQNHGLLLHAAQPKILEAADLIYKTFARGGKVLICGNGGSAAMANHFVAELVGRYQDERRDPLPAISLAADGALLTALGNDYGIDQIFCRQVWALGVPGDLFIGMTTSVSGNVLNALSAAKGLEMATIMFSGSSPNQISDVALNGHPSVCNEDGTISREWEKVDLRKTVPRIQENHLFMIHEICAQVETLLRWERESEAAWEGGDGVSEGGVSEVQHPERLDPIRIWGAPFVEEQRTKNQEQGTTPQAQSE